MKVKNNLMIILALMALFAIPLIAQEKKRLAPSLITLKVNGKVVGEVMAETTVPAIFTASETFDVGMEYGSGVALEYHDKVPFKFTGKINKLNIRYID